MKMINLTPHALNVKKADGQVLTIEPSGNVARVNNKMILDGWMCLQNDEVLRFFYLDYVQDGIEIFRSEYGDIDGLPPEKEGTIYIVSGMVLAAVNETITRPDVFAPGHLIRDPDGRVIGCQGLRSS
jgi:hypothetical protein